MLREYTKGIEEAVERKEGMVQVGRTGMQKQCASSLLRQAEEEGRSISLRVQVPHATAQQGRKGSTKRVEEALLAAQRRTTQREER